MLEDGSVVVEAAEAVGLRLLAEEERDPVEGSSRGLGELLLAAAAEASGPILVGLGDTATVDGGAGLLDVVGDRLAGASSRRSATCGTRCSASEVPRGRSGRRRAPRPRRSKRSSGVWPQTNGFDPTRSFQEQARPAALALRSPRLADGSSSGAGVVLERIGFHGLIAGADLVVTGEGTVDRSSFEGKAVGEVVRACVENGVRCAVFGGVVVESPAGAEAHALSGDPGRAAEDLVELGERLARVQLGVA